VKAYGGVDLSSVFLDLGIRWRLVVRFTPPFPYIPGTHWTGVWMGPKAGLASMGKKTISYPCRESNPGRPASSLVAILN
jgi:hypothetical protein